MRKIFLFFFFLSTAVMSAGELPKNFYKRMEGSVDGKYNITMNLIRVDSALSGNYYYEKQGEILNFVRSSIDKAGNVILEEDAGYDDDYNPKTTGIFRGKFEDDNQLKGTWENPEKKKLVFYLDEKYPAGSARFKVHSSGDGYDEYGSATIYLTWLEMINYDDKNVEKKINNLLKDALLSNMVTADDPGSYTDPEEMIDAFIESYIIDIVEDSANFTDHIPFYEYGSSTDIIYNSDYILALQTLSFSYLGGAHPNTFIELSCFDLTTGNKIELADIFVKGYEKKLAEIGEKKFREFYNLSAAANLDSAGFWFEDGFHLNENFVLTKGGIKFLFNQYEVGPYALGAPEVYIPFKEIKDLLRKESIVAPYLN